MNQSTIHLGTSELVDRLQQLIHTVNGTRVMLDSDLARLYGVNTFNLNKAVARNRERFPDDFVLRIPVKAMNRLIFQTGISKPARGGRRKPVLAFTQEGVAMLSSVLRSERAAKVNVEIMRTFVRFRLMLVTHSDLAQRLDELEQRYDGQFRTVFEAIRSLMTPPDPLHQKIGFEP